MKLEIRFAKLWHYYSLALFPQVDLTQTNKQTNKQGNEKNIPSLKFIIIKIVINNIKSN